jgi:hypothetical protein
MLKKNLQSTPTIGDSKEGCALGRVHQVQQNHVFLTRRLCCSRVFLLFGPSGDACNATQRFARMYHHIGLFQTVVLTPKPMVAQRPKRAHLELNVDDVGRVFRPVLVRIPPQVVFGILPKVVRVQQSRRHQAVQQAAGNEPK